MKILALESSCEHASLALFLSGELRTRSLDGHAKHSELMLSLIRELLAEAGLAVSALDAVAFGAGPGAFTGLRLSCGIAQGLALGAGLGVIPVCSLEALAVTDTNAARAGQAPPLHVLAATDARMGEVYTARYRVEQGIPTELSAPVCCPPDHLSCPEGEWIGLGSAFSAYAAELAPVREKLAACDPAALPSAEAVARLAATRGRAGILPAECAAPLYVRDKVALTVAERLARGNKA